MVGNNPRRFGGFDDLLFSVREDPLNSLTQLCSTDRLCQRCFFLLNFYCLVDFRIL